MKRFLLLWLSTVALTLPLRGQGFVNLDFESAQVIIYTNIGTQSYITTANALPGWSAFSGTNQLSLIPYYRPSVVFPFTVTLVGANGGALDGNFSVYLNDDDAISQTGLIPSDAKSLFFDALYASILVSLDGVDLSYVPVSNARSSFGASYTIYGADISSFAGQVETLTFSVPYGGGGAILDGIQFSPEAVPEPTSAAVLLLGGGVLILLRRKHQR